MVNVYLFYRLSLVAFQELAEANALDIVSRHYMFFSSLLLVSIVALVDQTHV